jgi:hypothetical protein
MAKRSASGGVEVSRPFFMSVSTFTRFSLCLGIGFSVCIEPPSSAEDGVLYRWK